MTKEFNKTLLASNISYLLKQKNMKIGTFEEQVNVSPGYLSRISKEDSIKPGIDFIVRAASILDTSIDILLGTDLTSLTATETYFKQFIEKLIKDTRNERLEWQCEKPRYLNNLEVDMNGNCHHPFFTGIESPKEGVEYLPTGAYDSQAFGIDVTIDDDCYNVMLSETTRLYVMHAQELDLGDGTEKIIEMWFYDIFDYSSVFVGSTKSFANLGNLIKELYIFIKKYMETPHLPSSVKTVIESYIHPKASCNQYVSDGIPF